ncbi:MAG TPA: relaxase/mobilization nuclease domain-containing protein [Longimicrobium sp.]|nr:relaxase/mobilization nuclease domain-containing protein [Longimicrobium sp.]
MIGRAFPYGKGFLPLTRYLVHGEVGEHRDRALWVESRNLPTEDPETAARLMFAHARESVRTQRPVYHFVISFDPGDPVNRESMGRVVDAVLRRLGLEEHQALLVAHGDTAHPHVHVVVNRVHPETHRAWENSWDWPKIEKELRVQEVELGMRIVPGHLGRVPGREPAPALARGDAAFLRFVQERAGPVLELARSWVDVEAGLLRSGLVVRIKGGGLSINDGRQEVKASEVDRAFSRKHIEARLGKLSAHRLTHAPQRAPLEPPTRAGVEEVRVVEPQPVHQPPPVARVQRPPPVQPAPPPPPEQAPQAGPLADAGGSDLPAWLDRERERVRDAGLLLRVREAHAHILAAKDVHVRNHAIGKAEGAAHAARNHLANLEAAAETASGDRVALSLALDDVYTDPLAAVAELVRYGRTHDAEQVLRELHDRPEEFGPLVRTSPIWQFGVGWTTMPAVKKARKVKPSLVEAAVQSGREGPTIRELVDAKNRIREADAHAADLRAARRELPTSATSERMAADLLRSALRDGAEPSWISQQLARLLPPGDHAAAKIAEDVLRKVFTNPVGGMPKGPEPPRLGGMDI